jgi:hypothetical protein
MRHKLGVLVLAAGALALGSASFAILSRSPGTSTAIGRHLFAGALANASLAITLFVVAAIPLRRGEPWAFWTLCTAVLLYGVPMLIVDGLNVSPERLLVTLAPQVGGLVLFGAGLALVSRGVFKARHDV